MTTERPTLLRTVARIVLGVALIGAGVAHLGASRTEFQAQVPDWVRLDKDLVVIVSGLVEIALGTALVTLRRDRKYVGLVAGLFFIAILPGNISQWIDGHDAFGLDSDTARFARLWFQPVLVGEPTVEDTISILRGLKERYEVHHGVRIKDAALVSAAVLSNRYITDRFLPDKAIDLVDESAAKLRTEIDSMPGVRVVTSASHNEFPTAGMPHFMQTSLRTYAVGRPLAIAITVFFSLVNRGADCQRNPYRRLHSDQPPSP